jgi:predicted RNase H-like nuclease (RuvC/YqgF family)
MIMQAQVDALQDEIHRLIAKLDESEARIDFLERKLGEVRMAIIGDLMADGAWKREAEAAPLPAFIAAALEGKP